MMASRAPLTTFQHPPNKPLGGSAMTQLLAVLLRENVLQGLRRCDAEIMRRKVTASKLLDGRSEESLDFDVQVEKPTLEKASQLCAYGGLADTADASEEYTHDPVFGERRNVPGARNHTGTDSCCPQLGLLTRPGGHAPAHGRDRQLGHLRQADLAPASWDLKDDYIVGLV
jgi:hypothetical protein